MRGEYYLDVQLVLEAVKGGRPGGGGGHCGGHLHSIDQSELELASVDQSETSIQVT